jgi:hypothetical protein
MHWATLIKGAIHDALSSRFGLRVVGRLKGAIHDIGIAKAAFSQRFILGVVDRLPSL